MTAPTLTPLERLVAILDLEQIELNIFRGGSPDEDLQRVFGGQVAGQALVAAGRTVPAERPVHSLHAYFLRPGDPAVPIVYEVDRIRDGRSFTTRRVVAVQHGRVIFNLSASFQSVEDGVDHRIPMPSAPPPESLPTVAERFADHPEQLAGWWARPRPIDLRYVDDPPIVTLRGGPAAPRQQVWLRTDGPLPDDPLLHVCAATYASDMTLLDSVLRRHGMAWHGGNVKGASLDHAMWFHRPFRADEWLLYDQDSPSASGGRGLAHGRIFTREGELVVSVMQEGLVRKLS
ncbi:MAG: acyl-CoA thioesterase II [Mycobacteriales bacterium]